MKVELNGNTFLVEFYREMSKKKRFLTHCKILQKTGEEPIQIKGTNETHIKPIYSNFSYGNSTCCPKDKFDREIGRRISLSRALNVFPRKARLEFFNRYFQSIEKSKQAGAKSRIKLVTT